MNVIEGVGLWLRVTQFVANKLLYFAKFYYLCEIIYIKVCNALLYFRGRLTHLRGATWPLSMRRYASLTRLLSP